MIAPELLYEKTLDIARRIRITESPLPEKIKVPRISTGGHFSGIFLWDTAFSVMWAKYHAKEFGAENSLDNLYTLQDKDGFIAREFSAEGDAAFTGKSPIAFAPPVLGWAEMELFKYNPGGIDRLKKVFPKLCLHHKWNRDNYRRSNGLYFGSTLGSGMDDLPRWDSEEDITPEGGIPFLREHVGYSGDAGDLFYQKILSWKKFHHEWNRQLNWCDLSCQMAMNARILSEMADLVGEEAKKIEFQQEFENMKDAVNETFFDHKNRFYFDRLDSKFLSRRHAGAYWALFAHIAEEKQADALIAELKNPNRFGLPCGIPGLAADDPDFDLVNGYWRGPVWAPIVYMVLNGLRDYGEEKLAREIAEKYHSAISRLYELTGTIWENIPPDQCERPSTRAGRDFCGWSALGAISIWREFLNN
ncbi:MAG: hypothetical protein IJV93_03580 [Lentisphaeria bacterium]|nr:hypothetical protein [Lentisphaeria bacterium]